MTPELVSIVIPCFKQAHFLDDAIQSALAQKAVPVEVIVVDDGSPDNTGAVAQKYAAVRYIRQENQGLPGARNTGFRISTGEFLIFLDADDRLLPNAVETGLKCLREHPDCAFASGHHTYISADGSPLQVDHLQLHVRANHYVALLQNNYIGCPGTAIHRRAVLEGVGGFDSSLRSSEDYELYLRIAREFPVCSHDEVVAEYRCHAGGMSRNLPRMLDNTLRVLRSQRPYVAGDREREEAWQRGLRFYEQLFVSEQLVVTARGQFRARQWTQLARTMVALLRSHPSTFTIHIARKARQSVVRPVSRAHLPT